MTELPPTLLALAAACATRDRAAVVAAARAIADADPTWHLDRRLVAWLVNDARFAFLLAHPTDVYAALGGTTQDLAALHRQHLVQTLLRWIDDEPPQ